MMDDITIMAIALLVALVLGIIAAYSNVARGYKIQRLQYQLKLEKLETIVELQEQLDELNKLVELINKESDI